MDISKLLEIMAALRDPQTGCPWDLEQSFSTIAPYTLEEAYEVADAIARDDMGDLRDELGDLLLQVVYHARIAEESGAFDFDDVVAAISEKMVRRHPHVFADKRVACAEAQTVEWEALKAEEQAGARESVLDGVPVGLPALTRSMKLGRRAARVGFDWPDAGGVRSKINEELRELDAAIAQGDADAVAAEMGDALFSLVNLCRHVNVDPESCLRAANSRFEKRFGAVEEKVNAAGGDWSAHELDALETFWLEAKRGE